MGRQHPVNEKRRCNSERHEGNRYLTVDNFHKQGFRYGKRQYRTECKKCYNGRKKEEYHQGKGQGYYGGWPAEKKKAYTRARSRAMTQLSKLVPELYRQCLEIELEKEPEFK